jgi:hypothetical protein
MSAIKVAPVCPAWPRDEHYRAADRPTGTFFARNNQGDPELNAERIAVIPLHAGSLHPGGRHTGFSGVDAVTPSATIRTRWTIAFRRESAGPALSVGGASSPRSRFTTNPLAAMCSPAQPAAIAGSRHSSTSRRLSLRRRRLRREWRDVRDHRVVPLVDRPDMPAVRARVVVHERSFTRRFEVTRGLLCADRTRLDWHGGDQRPFLWTKHSSPC